MLIAFCADRPGVGKTTAANLLVGFGFVRRRFAAPLKSLARTLLEDAGLRAADVFELIEGDRKEEPIAALGGVTARHLLQTLGTEWGRRYLGEDIWVRLAMAQLDALSARAVVYDDCRFPNEAAAIRARGGAVWQLARAGVSRHPSGHASETHLAAIAPDLVIANDGTVAELRDKLRRAVASIRTPRPEEPA